MKVPMSTGVRVVDIAYSALLIYMIAFWGNVVSDYQAFAAAHPQELAKAIEQGIPKSLRGMIWQLM